MVIIAPFVACDNIGSGKKMTEADSLRMALYEKDSLLNEVFSSLGAITSNLEQIKSREGVISSTIGTGEIRREPTAQIQEDIYAIDKLLVENRENLERLEKSAAQLRNVNVKVGQLETLIAQLTAQSEAKDAEIASLKDQLVQMNVEVEELSMQLFGLEIEMADMEGEIADKTEQLNNVYYILGDKKELVEKGIVYKSGFVGRTLKLNEVEALGELLVKVDRGTFDQLIIGRKGVEIVTSHPRDSYSLEEDENTTVSLVIKDKDNFWKYSRVLVVAYRK